MAKIEHQILREAKSIFSSCDRIYGNDIFNVSKTLYSKLPKDPNEFLKVCELFFSQKGYGYFSVATLWIKRRPELIDRLYLPIYEKVLQNDAKGWGDVDLLCYRILNPIIQFNPSLYTYLEKWSLSSNKNVRRASLVAMIQSGKEHKIDYDYDNMLFLVERLKNDEDIHVKKAVGWVLKVAYKSYPKKIERYLRNNVTILDRLIFRYALEHIENPLRKELLALSSK